MADSLNDTEISTDKLITDYLSDFADTPENFRKIFVGGLSWATTEDKLQQFFEKMGAPVDRLAIMRDKLTGRSRGFGFVTFVSLDGLNLVLSRKHQLDGRMIECKRAIPKSEISTKMKKVFVGGIPLTLEEPQLKAYFEKFGHVEECRIMTDGVSNRSRGFAFVCFSDDEVLNKVLSVPHSIEGKCFEVKRARGKAGQPEPQPSFPVNNIPPFYVPYNFQVAAGLSLPSRGLNNQNAPFPGFYVYPSLDPSSFIAQVEGGESSQTQSSTQERPPLANVAAIAPLNVPHMPPVNAAPVPSMNAVGVPSVPSVSLATVTGRNVSAVTPLPVTVAPLTFAPERSRREFDLDALDVPTKAANRKTLPVSSGKRGDKQKINRTVSANDKLELLTAGRSSTTISLQTPHLASLSTALDESDSLKQINGINNNKTIAQRRLGPKRNEKQKVNRTVSAHPTLQSTPTHKIVLQTTANRPSASFKPPSPPTPARLSSSASPPTPSRLPGHEFFSDFNDPDATYLERELNRFKTQQHDKKPTTQPAPMPTYDATLVRKRGLSSPVLPLETIRHLDLNWRSGVGGKPSDSTIHKYFPVMNPTELSQS